MSKTSDNVYIISHVYSIDNNKHKAMFREKGEKKNQFFEIVEVDVCLSSPSFFSYIETSSCWHVVIECVREHLEQKHHSIDHQTFLRVCMLYDGREAIEMQEHREYVCVFVFRKKTCGRAKKFNFFCLSLIWKFFIWRVFFLNTHFSYLSNSNIAVGLNRKTNRLRSLSYMYMSIPLLVCVLFDLPLAFNTRIRSIIALVHYSLFLTERISLSFSTCLTYA